MKRLAQFNEKLFKKAQQAQRGFSLVEILVALTLLGIAGTFVAGKIFQQLHEGKVKSAKIQMNSLAQRLKEFRRKCGVYPTTEQGLEALVTKPSGERECKDYPPSGFIEGDEVPVDPWDESFSYESDGKSFSIKSLGNDRQEGGEGEDEDILHGKSKKQSE